MYTPQNHAYEMWKQIHGEPVRLGRRVEVNPGEVALFVHNGVIEQTLQPGRYRYWVRGAVVRRVDTRASLVRLGAQELFTSDGVSVKLNVVAESTITNPEVYLYGTTNATEFVHLAVQVAVRTVVAAMDVDRLLETRGEGGQAIRAALPDLSLTGVAIGNVELKDVVLPPELKRARAEVLVAKADGATALERARGETASLRSLANAARQLADNPALFQLRLLQQLEASTGNTIVVGADSIAVRPQY